jgi:hypothetical protein
MATKCDHCPIRKGCDILSEMCRLTAREVVVARPELIRPLTAHQLYYRQNRDKYRKWNAEAGKRYRKNNRARRLEAERNWRAKHPEVVAKGKANWWRENKDRVNAERRAKRAEIKRSAQVAA